MKILRTGIAAILTTNLAAAGQEFRNLDFRQICDSSKTGLCYWDLSWGAENSVRPYSLDSRQSMLIEGHRESDVGFVEQSVSSARITDLQIFSISAMIRSDTIVGKGAGLNIGLYAQDGTLIANKDMGGFYSIDWIRGTNSWENHKISVVVPVETKTIRLGMILYGMGKAYYSDFRAEFSSIHDRQPSKLAAEYLTSASDTIERNSLVKDSLDMASLKETALKIAGPAKEYSECFLAINYLLESLRPFGDHHSFFMSAGEVENWENEGSQVSEIEYPSYKVMDGIGYIVVPPFHGGNPVQMTAYADSMQRSIKNLHSKKIRGWIIDLRQNTGGNMEPMIAGLGPLFTLEKLGALIDVNGNPEAWYYKDGRYFGDNNEGWEVTDPYTLTSALPIAVLTGNQTGSTGEVVTISFIGNARTKSFGQPTWGLTTGNGSFELKDGSQIFLASTVMADREAKIYATRITPDYLVEDNPSTQNDEVIDAAKEWILK